MVLVWMEDRGAWLIEARCLSVATRESVAHRVFLDDGGVFMRERLFTFLTS
jgi:hypothetical protein